MTCVTALTHRLMKHGNRIYSFVCFFFLFKCNFTVTAGFHRQTSSSTPVRRLCLIAGSTLTAGGLTYISGPVLCCKQKSFTKKENVRAHNDSTEFTEWFCSFFLILFSPCRFRGNPEAWCSGADWPHPDPGTGSRLTDFSKQCGPHHPWRLWGNIAPGQTALPASQWPPAQLPAQRQPAQLWKRWVFKSTPLSLCICKETRAALKESF